MQKRTESTFLKLVMCTNIQMIACAETFARRRSYFLVGRNSAIVFRGYITILFYKKIVQTFITEFKLVQSNIFTAVRPAT